MKIYRLLLVLGLGVLTQSVVAKTAYPNILFILGDDMGYDLVAGLNPESHLLKTPHIDKLLAQGLSFTDAHACASVCTPSRYGILTGRNAWRSRLKREVLWSYGMPLIEKGRLTLPEMLRRKGYYTACIGKWHLGMEWHKKDGTIANKVLKIDDKVWSKNPKIRQRVMDCEASIDFTQPITGGPTERGFDYYFGMDLPNMPPYTWIENNRVLKIPTIQKPKEIYGDEGIMCEDFDPKKILPTLTKRACKWIAEAAKKDKPFFLYLSLTSPHRPIAPADEFIGKSGLNKYGDFIYQTDWVVGQILKALEKTGEAQNTIVIFTTDNGTAGNQFRGLSRKKAPNIFYHFRGSKLSIYEGGHRLPLIVRWPGKTKPGSICNQTVTLNDFMASFAEMTNFKLPNDAAEDSFSILPILLGKTKTLIKYPHIVNQDYGGRLAIRDGDWKYIAGRKAQLYNLKQDIHERKNLAKKYPEKVQEMDKLLKMVKEKGRTVPKRIN